MQTSSISGWLQEYDQQSSPMAIHQVVNQIVCRKQQQKRSVSLCQRKQDQEPTKSNLIDQNRNKSQILKPPKVPANQNKIQELKKVMEFLQHNEQFKYDTHRIFDPNNPKFQPEFQQMIENKKEQFKIRLNQQTRKVLQPLQESNHPSSSTDRQTQVIKKSRMKTDQHQELTKTHYIHRVSSIKDIMPKISRHQGETQNMQLNRQVIQKGIEFLQVMIERHKENVQQFLPKKSKSFK